MPEGLGDAGSSRYGLLPKLPARIVKSELNIAVNVEVALRPAPVLQTKILDKMTKSENWTAPPKSPSA